MPAISAEAKLVIGIIAGFFGLLVPVLSSDAANRFTNWIWRKIFRQTKPPSSSRSPLRWVLLTISAFIFVVGGAIVTAAPTSTGQVKFTPTPSVTLSVTPPAAACVCESGTVSDTLSCLINTESDAANQGDLAMIQRIFAPTAHIYRGDTNQEWDSPVAYYLPTFKALNFINAVHYDIQPITVTANNAWTTSGSRGSYTSAGSTPTPYNNPNPSDHWVFDRNEESCWVITRYEFNAMDKSFLPTPVK